MHRGPVMPGIHVKCIDMNGCAGHFYLAKLGRHCPTHTESNKKSKSFFASTSPAFGLTRSMKSNDGKL